MVIISLRVISANIVNIAPSVFINVIPHLKNTMYHVCIVFTKWKLERVLVKSTLAHIST